MDRAKLLRSREELRSSVQNLLDSKTNPHEKVFLRLLLEVWQVDPGVDIGDVGAAFFSRDVAYFQRYFAGDDGDGDAEVRLFDEWLTGSLQMTTEDKRNVSTLVQEVMQLRKNAAHSA